MPRPNGQKVLDELQNRQTTIFSGSTPYKQRDFPFHRMKMAHRRTWTIGNWWVVVFMLALFSSLPSSATNQSKLRGRWSPRDQREPAKRLLLQKNVVQVPLFLEFLYIHENIAEQLDLRQIGSVSNLCRCIQSQTNGPVVAQTAALVNISITLPSNPYCHIVDTSRQFDADAVNIFGQGFMAFQMHISQNVTVVSEESVPFDTVAAIVAAGFQFATGGQRRFLNCLTQYSSFESVLSVKVRRGLSDQDIFPTAAPEATLSPSKRPTFSPTLRPTPSPSKSPSSKPTKAPTAKPRTMAPDAQTPNPTTIAPNKAATRVPETNSPTTLPTSGPTMLPTDSPTTAPSIDQTEVPSFWPSGQARKTESPTGVDRISAPNSTGDDTDETRSPLESNAAGSSSKIPAQLMVAVITSAIATVLVASIFICCCICCRKRSLKRPKAKFALTSKDGQLGKENPEDMIPGFVELDQRSLAETTLGERTAGRGRPRNRDRDSQKGKPARIYQSSSFDENSLYTTPFAVNEELAYKPNYTSTNVLLNQYARQEDYDSKILFPVSDSSAASSDGEPSIGPHSGCQSLDPSYTDTSQMSIDPDALSGSVALDNRKQYPGEKVFPLPVHAHQSKLTRAQIVSQVIDEGSSSYDIDTWSCEYEDFDRGSDDYEKEGRSRSPSHSSRSTTKAKNLSSMLQKRPTEGTRDSSNSVNSTLDERHKGGAEQESSGVLNFGSGNSQHLRGKIAPDPPSSWSHWSNMIQNSGSREGRDISGLASPLSKLLDSVTQAMSPLRPKRPTNIPAVTPEETESDIGQGTDTSLSRGDESTLIGLQFKDDTSESSASAVSESPWLFEKVEESLGPRSVTADLESLGGKSNLSMRSSSHRSRTCGSVVARSVCSRFSHQSGRRAHSDANETMVTPRSLEHDLKRLEKQLAALDSDVVSTSSAGVSSITGASLAKGSSVSSRCIPQASTKTRRVVVLVPPGKLGVILANRHDGRGTIISEIRESSPLFKMLSPGDKLVSVDEVDVTEFIVSQITSLMASRADRERRLAIITSAPHAT